MMVIILMIFMMMLMMEIKVMMMLLMVMVMIVFEEVLYHESYQHTFIVNGKLSRNKRRAVPINTRYLKRARVLGKQSINAPVTVSNIPN